MGGLKSKTIRSLSGCVGFALILLNISLAHGQEAAPRSDQPNRVSIVYVAPRDARFQELYDLLRSRNALEKIQEILSPFRLPEELIIKTKECGFVNCGYTRENSKPTVIICYEFLKHILESLPNETTPAGLTPSDAAIGQFFWSILHEVGHATIDILDLPVLGHEEDAADNFATYIMLNFGKGQARRFIGGAAWAWRAYMGDYQKNPVVRKRIADFASAHGMPQERFYNLLCLALGADPMQYVDLNQYLPATWSRSCDREYGRLLRAFRKEISPHIDEEMARRILDATWLPNPAAKSFAQ